MTRKGVLENAETARNGYPHGVKARSSISYLDPVHLLAQMNEALQSLWRVAQPDPSTNPEATTLVKLDAAAGLPNYTS